MFGLFKKKPKQLELQDINGNVLQVGDLVKSLRYDLGQCELVKKEDDRFYYKSKNGDEVSYTKMVDAITGWQKVEKIES